MHVGSVIHVPFYASSQQPGSPERRQRGPSGADDRLARGGNRGRRIGVPVGADTRIRPVHHSGICPCREPSNGALLGLSRSTASRDRRSPPIHCRGHQTPSRLPLEPGHPAQRWPDRSIPRPWDGGCWQHWPFGGFGGGRARAWSSERGRERGVPERWWPWVCSRRQLVVLATARNLVVALVGAACAVLVAFALSPLTPVGEARLAEPSTGLAFDPLVLLLGRWRPWRRYCVLGLWPSVRASRVQIGDERAPRRTVCPSWTAWPPPPRRPAW